MNYHNQSVAFLRKSNHASELLANIVETYRARAHFDAAFICKDRIIAVHRVILAMSSTFLTEILQQHDISSEPPCIHLVEFSSDIVEKIVCYIYTGEVHVHPHELGDFTSCAKHLGLKGLIPPEVKLEKDEEKEKIQQLSTPSNHIESRSRKQKNPQKSQPPQLSHSVSNMLYPIRPPINENTTLRDLLNAKNKSPNFSTPIQAPEGNSDCSISSSPSSSGVSSMGIQNWLTPEKVNGEREEGSMQRSNKRSSSRNSTSSTSSSSNSNPEHQSNAKLRKVFDTSASSSDSTPNGKFCFMFFLFFSFLCSYLCVYVVAV